MQHSRWGSVLEATAALWLGGSLLCKPFVPCMQVVVFPVGTLLVCKVPLSSLTLSIFNLSCYPSESLRLGRHDKPGDPRGAGRAGAERCEGKMVPSFAFSWRLSPPPGLSLPGQEMAVAT